MRQVLVTASETVPRNMTIKLVKDRIAVGCSTDFWNYRKTRK